MSEFGRKGGEQQVTEGRAFEEFASSVTVPLRQALVGALGPDRGGDAHSLAMAYAWEHSDRVMAMDAPVGYLFTVGRSRSRDRRRRLAPVFVAAAESAPDYEPGLGPALAGLPEKQRLAVFLVVGCGWSKAEVGRLTGTTEATVRAHAERGLSRLRRELRVEED